ncbi:hypothetical protein HJC23_006093 [Cyclotella cryptica]|uniref:Mitochondrial carrier n=1 Tax=Cyclotella cryptica TaxID=29204 RepID=A0ABD3QM42_9STRA|eukprot:CCRYP_004552-RA/>CCRYP_004552-RA protein AED:0.06 eAED:0.06 QI:342/1/1/1/1/1/3/1248/410
MALSTSRRIILSPWLLVLLLLFCLHTSSLTTSVDDDDDEGDLASPSLPHHLEIDAIESTIQHVPTPGDVVSHDITDSETIFRRALQKAIGGGLPGAVAGAVQVLSLMWLRTVINYQYRYGSTFLQSLTHLYRNGGLPRLYSGITFALIQAPLSRFVSTAANDGVSLFLQNNPLTEHWGPAKEVAVAALVVGLFRGMLMPIDTCKTVLQIEGGWGFERLMEKVRRGNVSVLYSGALANAISSFIGHYPWFYTYNLLSRNDALVDLIPFVNARNALIGFVSSIVSDSVANFMRVIKTTKQALAARGDDEDVEYGKVGHRAKGATYAEAIGVILAADGWKGLFGRGLKTRIFANALQSIVFTVIWRGLAERWSGKKDEQTEMFAGDDSSDTDEESDYKGYDYNSDGDDAAKVH